MKLKTLKEIGEGVITAGIIVVLPLVVFTLLTSKMPFFGIQSFVVLSGSMQPTLPVGSIIFTQKSHVYSIGDIISFQKAANTITHRVVGIEKNGNFKTQGDSNNVADSALVSDSSILGKEFFVIPYIGRFIVFLKTIPGFILLILMPTLLFVGLELRNIKKEIEREVEKKIMKKMENSHIMSSST